MNKILLSLIFFIFVQSSLGITYFNEQFNSDFTDDWTEYKQDAGSDAKIEVGSLRLDTGKGYAHTGVSIYTNNNFPVADNYYNISFRWFYSHSSLEVGHNGVFLLNNDCYPPLSGTYDCHDSVYYGVPTGRLIALLIGKQVNLSSYGLEVVMENNNGLFHATWDVVVLKNDTNLFNEGRWYNFDWILNFTSNTTAVYVNGTLINNGSLNTLFLSTFGTNFRIELHKSHYPYNSSTDTHYYDYLKVNNPTTTLCSYADINTSKTLTGNNASCFKFTNNNILFNCANYNISGNDAGFNYTFMAERLNNITIKNCNLYYSTNIFYSHYNNNTVFFNNTIYGGIKELPSTAFLRSLVYNNNLNSSISDNVFKNLLSNNTEDTAVTSLDGSVIFVNNSNFTNSKNNAFSNVTAVYVYFSEGVYKTAYKGGAHKVTGSNYFYVNNDTCRFLAGSPFEIDSGTGYVDINNSYFENLEATTTFLGNYVNIDGNVFNNTLNVYFGGDYSSFKNNFLFSSNETEYDTAMVRVYGDNITVSGNNLDGAFQRSGIETSSSVSNTIIKNNVINHTKAVYSDYAGIYIPVYNYAIVENNTIENFNMSGEQGAGISWTDCNVHVSNNKIKNGIEGFGLLMGVCENINATNMIIENISDYDVYALYSNIVLINSSFNKSNVYATNSYKFTNKYYADVYVKNVSGQAEEGTTVIARSVQGNIQNNKNTDSDGYAQLLVSEYVQNNTGEYPNDCQASTTSFLCHNPINFTANKTGYYNSSVLSNMTNSKIINIILNSLFFDNCIPVNGTDWNINEVCILKNTDYSLKNLYCNVSCHLYITNSLLAVKNTTYIGNITITNSTVSRG